MEAIKIRFCVEAIIRWEQMTHRSFRKMDFADEQDTLKLMYCSYVVGLDNPPTFAEFEILLSKKRFMRLFVDAMARYNKFLNQFVATRTQAEKTEDSEQEATIGSLATRLIVLGGIDARYVMRDMTLEDMPMFAEALSEKIRREEESRRLWTFYSILPHVDGKKLQSPEKMYVFPWEAEKMAAEARRVAEESRAEFEAWMRSEGIKPKTNSNNQE